MGLKLSYFMLGAWIVILFANIAQNMPVWHYAYAGFWIAWFLIIILNLEGVRITTKEKQ